MLKVLTGDDHRGYYDHYQGLLVSEKINLSIIYT